MWIYENGKLVWIDCTLYDPFPEPVEDDTDEESRELQRV